MVCTAAYHIQWPVSLVLMVNVILQCNFFKVMVYYLLQGSVVLTQTTNTCFLKYHLPFKQLAVEFQSSDFAVSGFIQLYCSSNLIQHNRGKKERKAFKFMVGLSSNHVVA